MKIARIVLEWILSAFVGICVAFIIAIVTNDSTSIIIGSAIIALIAGFFVAAIFGNKNAPILYGVAAGIITFFLWLALSGYVNENQNIGMFVALFILSLPYILAAYFALVIYPKIK